jgi:hypothetical protein
MAATVADRSSLGPQRCSEPVVCVARSMFVTIGAPGSFEGLPVRCFAGADIPSVTLVRESGRTHANLGKGSSDAGAPYRAGFAAVAAG